MRKVIGVVGVGTTLVSVPLALLSLNSMLTAPGHTPVPILGALTALFAGVAVTGAWLGLRNLRRARPEKMTEFDSEQAILRLAGESEGRITIAEVAAGCRMSIADARGALEKMCTHGVAEVLFADDDSIVYEFKGLLTEGQRRSAIDPVLADLRRARAASGEVEG